MSDARAAILGTLRRTRDAHPVTPPPSDFTPLADKQWPPEERLPRIRRMMEAVHTEFLEATEADWPAVVTDFLTREGAANLLYAPGTADGARLSAYPLPPREREGTHAQHGEGEGFTGSNSPSPSDTPSPFPLRGPLPSPETGEGNTAPLTLIPYDRPVEDFKQQMFEGIDAGLTGTLGAIADTGSLILWPSADEPRLLSLVPHIHVALLRADALYDSFWQAMRDQRWADAMPTNALLISGPSKTADIEQTLAYGVHGPKRLVVVIVR